MPPEATGRAPDKLSLVVFSGDYDRLHYALAMASAAIAVNKPVTLFFTMEGLRGLARAGADGAPGWHALRCADGTPAAERDADYAKRGVATFEEMLTACVQLGVDFMVCEMGLRAAGLVRGDLREDVPLGEGGIVSFLADASADGAMILI